MLWAKARCFYAVNAKCQFHVTDKIHRKPCDKIDITCFLGSNCTLQFNNYVLPSSMCHFQYGNALNRSKHNISLMLSNYDRTPMHVNLPVIGLQNFFNKLLLQAQYQDVYHYIF